MHLVKTKGMLLKYAHKSFKNNYDIVIAAVEKKMD